MLFKFVNRFKFVFPALYTLVFVLMIAALGYLFYQQAYCSGCSITQINPSAYLMPILAYLSIGLVGTTIGFTRKTASEKNALDFVKEMAELAQHLQDLFRVRQGMMLSNGKLDRRKASAYMESLVPQTELPKTVFPDVQPANDVMTPKPTMADQPEADRCTAANKTTGEVPEESAANAKGASKPTDDAAKAEVSPKTKHRQSAVAILNAMEGCANAIRYGIYDEDFIYNIYGSHFIELYELTYGFIKARQIKQARIWVNFEWLAVKWTLRRNITGVISKESIETSYIINQALAALKEHNKTRPIVNTLKRYEGKLERRKFPM
ncbi:hypothetical protein ALO95_200384 [Pseudomonas syringae pv. antirrhini]|nr:MULTISPECIES: DUF4760 domain-containing protein [Pseudomonas]RMW23480.1 hypothetical protein ALO95_200384 [Pseudomonas syringae pv. antirrhini]WIN08798.1 DUF4760 domain-containing protein [Pseudomonas syringae pv. antirrhini str. 126]